MSIKQWEKWAPGAHIFLEVYKSFFKLVQAIAEDAMEDMRFLLGLNTVLRIFCQFLLLFFPIFILNQMSKCAFAVFLCIPF